MNVTQDTASMICDKYALLRRLIQAMEIDAAGNHCFFFCLSAFPPLCVSLSLSSTHPHIPACAQTLRFIQTCDVTAHVSGLYLNVHTKLGIGSSVTCVLESERDLIQASELWTSILIYVLCRPRAHSVLMCAVNWTAAAQPWRLHIQSKSKASHFHWALL